MTTTPKAMAYDVDPTTLASLRAGLEGWEIEVTDSAAMGFPNGPRPKRADLFVVQAGRNDQATITLCRFLIGAGAFIPAGAAHANSWESAEERRQTMSPDEVLLIVLVPADRSTLVRAVLKAGASGCLVLPLQAEDVTGLLARARRGNQPGRHTLNLDKAQTEDRWRDDGGQG